MKATPVKTLGYLGGTVQRLIVAAKYLHDGRLMLIDRKNSVLLITDTATETTEEVDLNRPLLEEHTDAKEGLTGRWMEGKHMGFYTENLGGGKVMTDMHVKTENWVARGEYHGASSVSGIPIPVKKTSQDEAIKPSDVNDGFEDDQILVTYTGKDFSLGVVYRRIENQRVTSLEHSLTVKVMDRTRSIVVIDKDHFCATTQYKIVILKKSGDGVATHSRKKRDRGGLLMSDGRGRFFYGDGDEFVSCQWNGRDITEIYRFTHPGMIFPRGSAIDKSGWIVVCCDSSHNIFRVSGDGSQSEIMTKDKWKSFGDVDFHPSGGFLVTTFWHDNEWPVLFKVDA